MNSNILSVNIKNTITIIFLRIHLRGIIDKLLEYNSINYTGKKNSEYKNKAKMLLDNDKISASDFNRIIFLLVNVDNFFHIEKNPNLALNNIDLDEDYIKKIIKFFYEFYNNYKKSLNVIKYCIWEKK